MSISVGCVCGTSPLAGDPLAGGDIQTPNGGGGGGGVTPVDPGSPGDPVGGTNRVCQSLVLDSAAAPRLVDVILAIDNTTPMRAAVAAVHDNINAHFAQALQQRGVDYRAIVISEYGRAIDGRVCLWAPLGLGTCDPLPPAPVNGPTFFHLNQKLDDRDSLYRIWLTYDSWKGWLRPGSLRVFLEFTGGDSLVMSANSFESGMFAKGTFGTAAQREYIFHSIVGVTANNPATSPWLPSQPAMTAGCAGAAMPGLEYQSLSIRSGGLRFPVCEYLQYGSAFEAIADHIATAAGVHCAFTPPPPPAGERYSSAEVEYTPAGAPVEPLAEVAAPAACSPTGFWREAGSDRVILCPEACRRLRADPSASFAAHYTCVPATGP